MTQTLVQVLSTHSPDIVLDKYNFELGYDDDFDMGGFRIILIEITLKDDYIIESLIDVECRLDLFRRVCIGRRQRRRDARAEAEAQPRSHYQPVPLTGLREN